MKTVGDVLAGLDEQTSKLPTSLPADEVAEFLGISVAKLYRAVRDDSLSSRFAPIPDIRPMRWATVPLLLELGILTRVDSALSFRTTDIAPPGCLTDEVV